MNVQRILLAAFVFAAALQAGYIADINIECAPGIYQTVHAEAASASVSCPGNANIYAWVRANGSDLTLAMNQPGYSHVWDDASITSTDTLSVSSGTFSGPAILRVSGTLHAEVTGTRSDVLFSYREGEGLWGIFTYVDAYVPTRDFTTNIPITLNGDLDFTLQLAGSIPGTGSVDASRTATLRIEGVYLEDGTPVSDFMIRSASGERYGLPPLEGGTVPEPSTFALLAIPLGALALRARARRG